MIDGEDNTGAAPEKELSLDEILGSSLGEAYDAAQDAQDGAADTGRDDGRDEKGRFTAQQKAAAEAAAAGTPAAPNQQNPDQGQTQTAAPGADPASEPPASWSAAEKALWATLPPDVRAIVARREADFAKGIEQKAQGYKQLDAAIEPRREALVRTYGSVENGITELLGLSDFAVTKPEEFIQWFVHQHRLDPSKIFTGAPAGDAPQQGDGQAQGQPQPDIAAVQTYVDRAIGHVLETINAPIKAQAKSDLDQFAADPKNAHFQTVRNDMGQILANSRDPNMTYQQAYEQACWANPDIRKQLIEAERTAAIEAKTKEAAEAAKKARHTAGPQLRAVGTPGQTRHAPGSIDQTMSETFDRMNGAA